MSRGTPLHVHTYATSLVNSRMSRHFMSYHVISCRILPLLPWVPHKGAGIVRVYLVFSESPGEVCNAFTLDVIIAQIQCGEGGVGGQHLREPVVVCGVWTVDCGLWTVDCGV